MFPVLDQFPSLRLVRWFPVVHSTMLWTRCRGFQGRRSLNHTSCHFFFFFFSESSVVVTGSCRSAVHFTRCHLSQLATSCWNCRLRVTLRPEVYIPPVKDAGGHVLLVLVRLRIVSIKLWTFWSLNAAQRGRRISATEPRVAFHTSAAKTGGGSMMLRESRGKNIEAEQSRLFT